MANLEETILVVGGAGYIGSHMVKMLLGRGYGVTTLDNLSSGHRDAVLGGEFVLGDLADRALLDKLFRERKIGAVMHFASFIQVGESVQNPAKYYENNVVNTLNLLDAMVAHNVKRFIFSSSAAVYGNPIAVPIPEDHPKLPINPYGRTKWMVEQILEDYDRAYGLKSVSLRYFNAAGADPEGQLGERHEPETHLIPLILRAASGRAPDIKVFGRDYDTPDGTCIRDYVHIVDLCEAHLFAMERLMKGASSAAYNLGNGNGFSVAEVIATTERVTARKITVIDATRREGDPPRLVADASRARAELGWQPRFDRLDSIIEHAWAWECKSVTRLSEK
ncbi:UDP-glucose 4-epimerase GalE [Sulfurimicrobium lacus]|uniref:UDP-glucose 4-epimerase n=1 Tax=Sulfurimicrobium lacus TaxID=2715678 RepID=A0A6F8VCV4_9PROT|nr:UDP-glucose 4-epimerase GalE [Sulfurimicrobium lacus]BCB26569.1 UDP-glucose 4-epimerase GalE [Sulfurimicrobium lacus]